MDMVFERALEGFVLSGRSFVLGLFIERLGDGESRH